MQIDQTQETTQTQENVTQDLGNLSFADYERARRGEKVESSEDKSAPDAKATEQKEPSESETEETEADETEAESEESDEVEESKKDKPKKGGFQRRIDKLSASVRAEREEKERERSERLRLQERLAQLEKGVGDKVESKKVESDGEPKADDFETYSEYSKALARWEIRQELRERDQMAEEKSLKEKHEKSLQAHYDREKSFADKTEDYAEIVPEFVESVNISAAIQELILSSEDGPAILYALAKDRKEFARINSLSPLAQAKEIGKIEDKISSKASEPKQETKKLTNAPKPIEPVGGAKGSTKKSLSDPDLSFADYERLRREQMKRR